MRCDESTFCFELQLNKTKFPYCRSASLLIRKLDSIVAKALQGSGNLFTAEAIELRSQLTHLCNRSIIADPVQCRRKAEELLWRKCYYEVISAVKLNAKVCKAGSQFSLNFDDLI